jgi:glycosyltransferase involved in cell wall biosynthesis
MPTPFISVIIPVFNNAKDIGRCLQSILKQPFDDLEVLVIDDGSTDGSIDIIKSYTTENASIKFYQEQHRGVSTARNVGIEAAQGEYLLFIDADDEIEDNYIPNIADKARSSHADILLCGIKRCFADGHTEEWKLERNRGFSRKDFLENLPSEQYGRHKGIYGFVSNKLVKRDIVNCFHLRFDRTLNLMEDYSFFLDCYAHCETFMCLSETGYRYKIHDNHLEGHRPRDVSYMQLIDVQTKCIDLLKEEGVWTTSNEQILYRVIGNFVLAMFLEMKIVNSSLIKENLSFVRKSPYSIPALQTLNTKRRLLKHLILMKSVISLLLYVKIWRFYLFVRTMRLS